MSLRTLPAGSPAAHGVAPRAETGRAAPLPAPSLPADSSPCRRPPALTATLTDPATGTTGFIVADSLVGGRAMGGTRIAQGVTLDEAAGLAHRMSLKLALAEVDIGGAKGAVVLDPGLRGSARRAALAGFGRQAVPLLRGGVYIGTDLGCSYQDRALIHRSAGYRVRDQAPSLPCSWHELPSTRIARPPSRP